jgi:hypothetical protein
VRDKRDLACTEETPQERAVCDVGNEGYGWCLPSVVKGEQPLWLEHRVEAGTAPLGSHPGMDARKQRHYDHQGGEAMKRSEERTEPPRAETQERNAAA